MNKKGLIEFGMGVLTVIVGLALYDAVKPMLNKTTISPPTEH